jgi:hypothetical protein
VSADGPEHPAFQQVGGRPAPRDLVLGFGLLGFRFGFRFALGDLLLGLRLATFFLAVRFFAVFFVTRFFAGFFLARLFAFDFFAARATYRSSS